MLLFTSLSRAMRFVVAYVVPGRPNGYMLRPWLSDIAVNETTRCEIQLMRSCSRRTPLPQVTNRQPRRRQTPTHMSPTNRPELRLIGH